MMLKVFTLAAVVAVSSAGCYDDAACDVVKGTACLTTCMVEAGGDAAAGTKCGTDATAIIAACTVVDTVVDCVGAGAIECSKCACLQTGACSAEDGVFCAANLVTGMNCMQYVTCPQPATETVTEEEEEEEEEEVEPVSGVDCDGEEANECAEYCLLCGEACTDADGELDITSASCQTGTVPLGTWGCTEGSCGCLVSCFKCAAYQDCLPTLKVDQATALAVALTDMGMSASQITEVLAAVTTYATVPSMKAGYEALYAKYADNLEDLFADESLVEGLAKSAGFALTVPTAAEKAKVAMDTMKAGVAAVKAAYEALGCSAVRGRRDAQACLDTCGCAKSVTDTAGIACATACVGTDIATMGANTVTAAAFATKCLAAAGVTVVDSGVDAVKAVVDTGVDAVKAAACTEKAKEVKTLETALAAAESAEAASATTAAASLAVAAVAAAAMFL